MSKPHQLRWYQEASVNALLTCKTAKPLCVLPTGAGKTLVINELCDRILHSDKDARIVVTTHLTTLIDQLSSVLPKREEITIGTVQYLSNWSRRWRVDRTTHLIIDEAHLVSEKETGNYQRLIKHCAAGVRVYGLTATPYRLDLGHLLDGTVFTEIAYSAPIDRLCAEGFLCRLVSPATGITADLSSARTFGASGDYMDADAAKAIEEVLPSALSDAVERLRGRSSVLVFVPTIALSEMVAERLRADYGIKAIEVHSKIKKDAVDATLADFKAGRIRMVVSVTKIATGFDATNVDAIVILRPTMSPGLHVQMLGRGMRVHQGKADCLVLDYAGNLERHGSITEISAPEPKEKTDAGPRLVVDRDDSDREIEINAKPSTVDPMAGLAQNHIRCGFCGKSQWEVKTIIVGQTAFICNECVDECVGTIARQNIEAELKAKAAVETDSNTGKAEPGPRNLSTGQPIASITRQQVADWVADGKSLEDIALACGHTPRTVHLLYSQWIGSEVCRLAAKNAKFVLTGAGLTTSACSNKDHREMTELFHRHRDGIVAYLNNKGRVEPQGKSDNKAKNPGFIGGR